MPALFATRAALRGTRLPAIRRAVAGRTQFPSTPSNANSSGYTQVQSRWQVHLLRDVSDIVLTVGHFARTSPDSTYLPVGTKTVRLGISDGTSFWPVSFGGVRDKVLAPGEVADSDPVAIAKPGGTFTAGTALLLIELATWATAPSAFPCSRSLANSGLDYNEWGNALVDKTTGGTFAAARTVANYTLNSVLAIKGTTSSPGAVVGVLGDSISSDHANDTALPHYTGWVDTLLARIGIPYVNVGISGQALFGIVAAGNAVRLAAYLGVLKAGGCTHVLCPLGTNDWSATRTAAQLYADMLTLKTTLDGYGMKLVPTTLQPKTNTANTTYCGSETATFAQRALYNAQIIANNGVGYGYLDVGAAVQDAANPSLWRTDLLKVTGASVQAGGSGYAQADNIDLPGCDQLQVASLSGSAAATLTVRKPGAYAAAPANPVAATAGNRNGGPLPGTGLTVNLTTASAGADTNDGIHPGPTMHAWLAQALATRAAAVLA